MAAGPHRIVLDGSIVLAWCFPDERNVAAQAVLTSLSRRTGVVPAIWPLEVANALLVGERRGRSTRDDTARWTGFLRSLPIVVDEETAPRAWAETLELARTRNVSAYDASYLEIALRHRLPLASLDRRLRTEAEALGLKLAPAKL